MDNVITLLTYATNIYDNPTYTHLIYINITYIKPIYIHPTYTNPIYINPIYTLLHIYNTLVYLPHCDIFTTQGPPLFNMASRVSQEQHNYNMLADGYICA